MNQLALPFVLERRVQLWEYRVSHSLLLFRANKRPGTSTRIDVMFRAVRQMKVDHRYEDLTVSVLSLGEAGRVLGLTERETRRIRWWSDSPARGIFAPTL